MKILYDGYVFAAQRAGGISRYFANLISNLPADWQPTIRYVGFPSTIWPRHTRLRSHRITFDAFRPQRLARQATRASLNVADAVQRYRLLHPTFHFLVGERLIGRSSIPMVFTVYDTIAERFAASLDPSGREVAAKRQAIEAADAIICISEHTKRDVQELYRIPDSRITVTHLAANLPIELSYGDEAVPDPPYMLFLGNRGLYKNFARALLALSRIADSWPDLWLCVVGDPFHMGEQELISALGLTARVQNVGFVPDPHLAKLYRCSEALIYPSLYEGFGIPPLEAMSCGTIVICSNTSSLPEVVGDAAIMIDPSSVDELADAMLSIRNIPNRDQLVENGHKRAAQFAWADTAQRTAEVYRQVAR